MTSSVAELLGRLAEIGAEVRPAGDRLIVRAGAKPVPADLVRRLRQTKAEVMAALEVPHADVRSDDAAWWKRQFAIRVIERQLGGERPHDEAARLAFGDLINEWHRRHGSCLEEDCCAGCGDELPSEAGLIVDRGGIRIHFDAVRGFDCLVAYGQRWRSEAVTALEAMGLDAPGVFTDF